jgi:peptidyl-tRNA hydrolase
MNMSGPSIKRCWDAWRAGSESRRENGKLVIVHDELEGEMGAVKVRVDPKLSAKLVVSCQGSQGKAN